jgi:hypothetical protein
MVLNRTLTKEGNMIIDEGKVRKTFNHRQARRIMAARHLGAFSLFARINRKLSGDVKRAIRYHEFVNDWKSLILVDTPQLAIVLTSMLMKKMVSEAALQDCLTRQELIAEGDRMKQCAFKPELVMLIKATIIGL